jgi:hypothetical protein
MDQLYMQVIWSLLSFTGPFQKGRAISLPPSDRAVGTWMRHSWKLSGTATRLCKAETLWLIYVCLRGENSFKKQFLRSDAHLLCLRHQNFEIPQHMISSSFWKSCHIWIPAFDCIELWSAATLKKSMTRGSQTECARFYAITFCCLQAATERTMPLGLLKTVPSSLFSGRGHRCETGRPVCLNAHWSKQWLWKSKTRQNSGRISFCRYGNRGYNIELVPVCLSLRN